MQLCLLRQARLKYSVDWLFRRFNQVEFTVEFQDNRFLKDEVLRETLPVRCDEIEIFVAELNDLNRLSGFFRLRVDSAVYPTSFLQIEGLIGDVLHILRRI